MTDVPTPTPPPPPSRGAPVGRIVMIVIGVLLLFGAGAVALGGAALTWAHATQRDADGFFSTSAERLDTATPAITSEEIDLGVAPDDRRWLDIGDLATVRIEVDPVDEGAEVFVGVGPEEAVDAYLEGVSRAEIEDIGFDPFEVEYRFIEGDAKTADPPGEQTFWVAEGSADQPLEWELEDGNWVVVVMNADGSAGISIDTAVAAKVDWLLPLGLGLLIGGLLVVLGGVVLIVLGIAGLAHRTPAEPLPAMADGAAGRPPVRLTGTLDEPLSRWLWLVKLFLLIPHFIVLGFLWLAVLVVTVVAWFAILFTGRYPQPLFVFTSGVLRWTWRVSFYSFGALGTDRYPPFSFEAEHDYPATLDIDYPERLSRGLVLVKSWFLAIPHLLILSLIVGWGSGSGTWGGEQMAYEGPRLLDLLVFIAGAFLLFTARYPRSLFDFVMGLNRWVFRVLAYVLLLRDDYPPFRLDQGEDEPPSARVDQEASGTGAASG